MEMSVINGLKNLKDFQREITLLNIEKLLGQTTTESAKKERSKLQVLMICLIFLDVKVVTIFLFGHRL